jgi:hypothetical protein
VFGDAKQFSNVKAAQASNAINASHLADIQAYFSANVSTAADKLELLKHFDVKKSILEFFDLIANYNTMLRKHFRGYQELISFSSRHFYDNSLQSIKIRSKPVSEIIRFKILENVQDCAVRNTNRAEAEFIRDELRRMLGDGMGQAEFFERAQSICARFASLNPYEKKGSIFKIEDANYQIASDSIGSNLEPLFCYCISSKRYVLFNAGSPGEAIIRKVSAHGLGHYLAPHEADDAPQSIPSPSVALDKIGVERWHYDLWHRIVRAALDGHPDPGGPIVPPQPQPSRGEPLRRYDS